MAYASEISKRFSSLIETIKTENKISLEMFSLPKNKLVYWFSVNNSQYAVIYDKIKSDFTIFNKDNEIKSSNLETALKNIEYILSCNSK